MAVSITPSLAPTPTGPPRLVRRTYRRRDAPAGSDSLFYVYHCGACDKEFPTDTVADHMLSVHGCSIGPTIEGAERSKSGVKQSSEIPPAQPSAHQIVRKIYRAIEQDGTEREMSTHVCPCCQLEFSQMRSLLSHMSEVHQVHIQYEETQEDKQVWRFRKAEGSDDEYKGRPTVQVCRITMPGGASRLECPMCQAHFASDDQAAFLEHSASIHGKSWGFSGNPEANGPVSDHLDKLYQGSNQLWHPHREALLARFHVISLGHFCGVKFSIQNLGLGNAHLPFDWLRSNSAGLCHFLRSDFEDFFSVACWRDVRNANLRMYRSERHSFWHDDIAKPEARAKLQRRINRFRALRDDAKDLVFVRNVTCTDELSEVEDLYTALCDRFDGQRRRVLLVVIVDGQEGFQGPIRHAGLPGVIFYGQNEKQDPTDSRRGQVYCRAISNALDMALAAPEHSHPSVGFGAGEEQCDLPVVSNPSELLNATEKQQARFLFFNKGLLTGYGDLRSYSEVGTKHFDMNVTGFEDLPLLPDDQP